MASHCVLARGRTSRIICSRESKSTWRATWRPRNYDDKDGKKVYITEVICDHLVLLGGRQDGGGPPSEEYSQQPVSMPRSASRPVAVPSPTAPVEEPGFNQGITDDDVPF